MAEITDEDILTLADHLAGELDLDAEDRNVVVLAVQRMLWPPSPHAWIHEGEHITKVIRQREKGGWTGELRCPHGCGRRWTVNMASGEEVVGQALFEAHQEYRTGRITRVAMPNVENPSRKLSFGALMGRIEQVEVHDERLEG